MRAFEGPDVWRGGELAERTDWQHTLSADEVAEIEAALTAVERRGQDAHDLAPDDFPLPTLARRLAAVQDSLEHGSGSFLLRGWPAERFDVEANCKVFAGVSCHLGMPVSQSARGERIFRVEDAGLSRADVKARGPNSSQALRFHCDRCDVIGFLCIRQAKTGGDSYLVSSATIHNEMLARRPDLLELLYEPWYYKTHNVDTSNPDPWCHQPIYAQVDGKLVGYVLRVLIDRAYALPELPAMSPEQKEALDFLDALCADASLHYRFRQRPGDFFFVNNFTNFHSRSAFEDHEDPARKRLLLRIWLSVPNSRPLPASFAGSFGRTEAGALRGGIHPPTAAIRR